MADILSVWGLAAVAAAYLIGSLSFAVIVSKFYGLDDPRSYGSGNPGATNVLRSGRKKAAALTLLGDALKGLVAVLLARWLQSHFGLADEVVAAVAVAVLAGHMWPLFFGFKGGKGVATAGGVLLALNPLHGLAVLATWLAVAFLTRYSSLAAITAAFMAPIYWQLFYGIDARALVILFIAALLVWRHRENINRLLKGKESKIGGNKAPKPPKVKYPPPRVGGH